MVRILRFFGDNQTQLAPESHIDNFYNPDETPHAVSVDIILEDKQSTISLGYIQLYAVISMQLNTIVSDMFDGSNPVKPW